MIIMTKDRAGKLCHAWTERGFHIQPLTDHPPSGTRMVNGIIINIAPYARIWKGSNLRATINHEWIDAGSVLL